MTGLEIVFLVLIIVQAYVSVLLGMYFHYRTQLQVRYAADSYSALAEEMLTQYNQAVTDTNSNLTELGKRFVEMRDIVMPVASHVMWPHTKG